MGSFTTGAATQLMKALFNTAIPTSAADGRLVSLAAIAGTHQYAIYSYNTTTGTGIYSASSVTSFVRHRIDLIQGTAVGLTDACFATNNTFQVASTGGTGFANYTNYQGMSQRTDSGTDNNHSWQNWTLGTGAASSGNTPWKAENAQQIGFPTAGSGSSPNTIVGFCLSAAGSQTLGTAALGTGLGTGTGASAAFSTTQLLSAAPTTTQVIFAFGDLSSPRTVNGNDTPVFTQNAIVITLD